MDKLKAIFLLGTLKPSSQTSNTETLSEFLSEHLAEFGVESEIVRLIDFNIKPGVYTHIDDDDWPMILEKIKAADIVILATPVWWDLHSSLIQRAVERLDEIHDEIVKTGRSPFANKVAGIVATGDSDGAMHIIGCLTNFFIAIGFTIPPFPTLTVLWEGQYKGSNTTKKELWDYYKKTNTKYAEQTAKSLASMARLLKENPID